MTIEEFNYIKNAFSLIIEDIAGNPDWPEAARAVASDLGILERKLEEKIASLPSDLDEAADCYKDTIEPEDVDDYVNGVFYETFTEYQIADAFKAGAEWMAGQGVKLKCWIARDECSGDESNLYIGQQKPRRMPETAPGFGMWCGYGEFMALPPDMFPELTYSDEPIEVELIINKK